MASCKLSLRVAFSWANLRVVSATSSDWSTWNGDALRRRNLAARAANAGAVAAAKSDETVLCEPVPGETTACSLERTVGLLRDQISKRELRESEAPNPRRWSPYAWSPVRCQPISPGICTNPMHF